MNSVLAELARNEALSCFHGNCMGSPTNLKPIADLFPYSERWTVDSWDNCWCAAFVYYCVIKSGYALPVKYPDDQVLYNFAAVAAWVQWAKLSYISIWHESYAIPEIGDIVIFDRVFDGKEMDHIAIVVDISKNEIETAEGNFNNVSCIVKRNRHHVRGYIRLF